MTKAIDFLCKTVRYSDDSGHIQSGFVFMIENEWCVVCDLNSQFRYQIQYDRLTVI